MEKNLDNREALIKLQELANEVKVAMMATIHNGTLYSRPMHTLQVDDDGCLWFFTNQQSGKVDDVQKEGTVYLMYSHPGKNSYMHLKGTSGIVNDRQKIDELWSDMMKAWFPKGKDDPNLCLMKVHTDEASYWDSSSNSLVVFYKMVKGMVTSQRQDTGDTGKLDI